MRHSNQVSSVLLMLAFVFSSWNVAFGQSSFSNRVIAAAKNRHVLVAAHRGGYSNDKLDRAPENSLANIRLAVKKGYDVYETDIQRTADGVFVIVHDATLERETNGSGATKDHTLAELKALRKRYRDGSLSKHSVTTLEELLKAGEGQILFKPDLKPGMVDHFADLARLISQLGMTDQVFLRTEFSKANQIKQAFANDCPRVEVMFKAKSVAEVKSIIRDFRPKTIQINLAKGESISVEKAAAIREAVSAGVLVETHIYGDSQQWQKLAELGVRMFHTSNPDASLRYLHQNNWRQSTSNK